MGPLEEKTNLCPPATKALQTRGGGQVNQSCSAGYYVRITMYVEKGRRTLPFALLLPLYWRGSTNMNDALPDISHL